MRWEDLPERPCLHGCFILAAMAEFAPSAPRLGPVELWGDPLNVSGGKPLKHQQATSQNTAFLWTVSYYSDDFSFFDFQILEFNKR